MDRLEVAVIGARGIGKQHAKWFAMEGCAVVAFVSTTAETLARTEELLKGLFDFQGRGYLGTEEMLEKEKPDLVVVSSPMECHHDHALAALEAGCHVYCEKPLTWYRDRNGKRTLEAATQVVEAARKSARVLGVNAQYPAALPHYQQLYEEARGPLETVGSVYFLMESKGGGGEREGEAIWIDLGPHLLSMTMAWVPDGSLDESTLDVVVERKRTTASFTYFSASGQPCAVTLECRNIAEGTPARRFGVNGFLVDCSGKNDDQGIFRALLRTAEGKEVLVEDFVHSSVKRMIRAVTVGDVQPYVTGETALRNLQMQVAALRTARMAG